MASGGSVIEAVVYGQILSLILSSTFVFNQEVNLAQVFSSIFPNEIMYHVLFLVCLFKVRYIFSLWKDASVSLMLWALLMGAVDCTANFALIASFQYTTGVSAVLISSTAAVLAVPMSMGLLGTRYNFQHVFGIIVVMVGLLFINIDKLNASETNGAGSTFTPLGSILALIASFGFAASSVIQVHIINALHPDNSYPWGALAVFGTVSSIISVIVAFCTPFGQTDTAPLFNTPDYHVFFIIGYILALSLFYFLAPMYLQRWSAVNFQMSILTADIGTYIFNTVVLKYSFSILYICGFVTVLVGLTVFNLADLRKPYVKDEAARDAEKGAVGAVAEAEAEEDKFPAIVNK